LAVKERVRTKEVGEEILKTRRSNQRIKRKIAKALLWDFSKTAFLTVEIKKRKSICFFNR
jgi:hypothetical protein